MEAMAALTKNALDEVESFESVHSYSLQSMGRGLHAQGEEMMV
jgi:hypothetical protein